MIASVSASRRTGVALVLVLAVLLTIAVPVGVSGDARATAPPVATVASAPAPAGTHSGPAIEPSSAPVGNATRTLVLYNETVFDYNASAQETAIGGTTSVAFDSTNDTGWAITDSDQGAGVVSVFDASTSAGVRQMAAGENGADAYDPVTNTMWVTGGDTSNNVTVFDASTYGVARVLGTGDTPEAIVYDNVSEEMFIVNFGSLNVTVINASTYVVQPIAPYVGEYARGIAFDWKSRDLFVTHQLCTCSDNNVTIFYQSGNAPHSEVTFPSAGQEYTIVDDPQNDMVYVADVSTGLGIIDALTNASVGSVAFPDGTGYYAYDGIAIDTQHHRLYVSLIDTDAPGDLISYAAPTSSTYVALSNTSLGYDALPEGIAYDPTDDRILVTDTNQYDGGSMNVTEVSTSTDQIVGSVGLQHLPGGTVYDPATSAIYTYDGGNGLLYEISDSTDQVVATAFVGFTEPEGPAGVGISGQVAYDPTNDSIFVDWYNYVESSSQGVAEFSATSLTFLHNWTTGFDVPTGLTYDATDQKLFVGNYYSSNVTAISTATGKEGWVPAGDSPIGVVYDAASGYVFVANSLGDNVTVFAASTGAYVSNVHVGDTPWGEVVDPANGLVYVANYISGTLTEIEGSTGALVTSIGVYGISGPAWLAYDSVNQTIIASYPGVAPTLAAHTGIGLVNATNNTYFGEIEFGNQVYGLAYDPGTGSLFAAANYPGAVYEVYFGAGGGPPPAKLRASLAPDPTSIPLGSSTDLETSATGGSPPYSYAYSTLPPGCTQANVADLSCTPTAAGTYFVGVNVTDAKSSVAAAVAELTVTSTAVTLQVQIQADPSPIVLGASTTFETTATGGTGAGSYTYVYSTLPAGCVSSNQSMLPCTPSSTGTFYVGVNVTDALGNHGESTAVLTVQAAPVSLSVSVVASPTTLTLGNATQLTATVHGSPTGPLSYSWPSLPPGCTGQNQSSIACTPSGTGTFLVKVMAHDSAGHFANGTTNVTITSSSAPHSNSSSSFPWTWVLVAIIIVIAVILLFVVVGRRRKKEPPAPANGTPPNAPTQGPPPT